VITKTLKDGPKDELASPRDVQGSRQRRLTSLQDAQRLLGERYMPPGRCHVFASFTSLNLHGDAKDVERRTGRFPDVYIQRGRSEVNYRYERNFSLRIGPQNAKGSYPGKMHGAIPSVATRSQDTARREGFAFSNWRSTH